MAIIISCSIAAGRTDCNAELVLVQYQTDAGSSSSVELLTNKE